MPVVAKFEIDSLQYLDAEGRLVRKKLPAFARDLAHMVELYRWMVRTRVFDAKAIALQRTGKIGTFSSCLGHEATYVGIGAAMRPEDVFAPSYREHGVQLYRGVRPREMFLFAGGDERGNDYQNEPARHDFSTAIPIGTQCGHAAGAALAFKIRGEKRVAVCTIGDGGTSKGDFNGAINIAGARHLPLVAVIVNNQWAISVPRRIQTGAETLAQKAIAAGLPGIQVDGNDLIAVRQAVGDAVERARAGDGGGVVECLTYRLGDHTTADDAARYRPKEEVDAAWKKEPIRRLRTWLESQAAWDAQKEQALQAECAAWINAEAEAYAATAAPPVTDMFDYTFAELPEDLAAQRAAAVAIEEGH
jgi:pyruvate dehydrogenase E1 component alpha subunit